MNSQRQPLISASVAPCRTHHQQHEHQQWGKHVDDETVLKSGPRLRLMLIVIGVVYYLTPTMLALALLWEISSKKTKQKKPRKNNLSPPLLHPTLKTCSWGGWCRSRHKVESGLTTKLCHFCWRLLCFKWRCQPAALVWHMRQKMLSCYLFLLEKTWFELQPCWLFWDLTEDLFKFAAKAFSNINLIPHNEQIKMEKSRLSVSVRTRTPSFRG